MTMTGTYTSEGTLNNAESIRTIHRALDLGVAHIDTAEIYGPFRSRSKSPRSSVWSRTSTAGPVWSIAALRTSKPP
jgi:hypothetical protein